VKVGQRRAWAAQDCLHLETTGRRSGQVAQFHGLRDGTFWIVIELGRVVRLRGRLLALSGMARLHPPRAAKRELPHGLGVVCLRRLEQESHMVPDREAVEDSAHESVGAAVD
jgi:hypothetical protein